MREDAMIRVPLALFSQAYAATPKGHPDSASFQQTEIALVLHCNSNRSAPLSRLVCIFPGQGINQLAFSPQYFVRQHHHSPVRPRDWTLSQDLLQRLTFSAGTEPVRVHDQRRCRGTTDSSPALNQHLPANRFEALG